jgi:mono/diheme cytochrome c family protein
MTRFSLLPLAALVAALVSARAENPSAPAAATPAGKLEYNRDIRPILAENCFACHGTDSAARKAGLRLDQRDSAIDKGAIEPGKPDKSELVERINLPEDDKQAMPPAKSHKTLKPEQKEMLKRWIAQGAEYQAHWSLIPPHRPTVPDVPAEWQPRNPIDNFVFAELGKHGLSPNPEADRATLARRLALDLTGLPPDPADADEFINDRSPDYYEKYVEKLMRSPQWGEHRGRYWLDAARFADSNGIHFDNYREIWSYRDWVINALNQNMKFDAFTIEQLAGDLLPNATLDQKIATGFNRCNITTNEGGAIAEEYLVLYTRDRTETVSQVWMGLTAGCAVCHNHKFDPISQKDFYSMAAFFNNTTQNAMDGNISDTPPVIQVPRAEDRARFEKVGKEIATAKQELEARKKAARGDFDHWLVSVKPEQVAGLIPTDKLHLLAKLTEGKGKAVKLAVDGKERSAEFEPGAGYTWGNGKPNQKGLTVLQSGPPIELADAGDFAADKPFSYGAWVKLSKRNTFGAIAAKMDTPANGYRGWDLWAQSDRVGTHIISKWQEDALKAVAKKPLKVNEWTHVFVTYDGSKKAAGVKIYYDGQPQPVDVEADALKGTIKNTVPFTLGQRYKEQRVAGVSLYDLRVYGKALSGVEVGQLAKSGTAADVLAKPADKRSKKEIDELFDWWLVTSDKPYLAIDGKLSKLQQEEAAIRSRGTVAHVSAEKNMMPEAYILSRGEYDRRKDKVGPATPEALPPFPADLPKNRLGFAKWLVRPDQPLTARVTVNRFWQELFGTGIVRTSGDFGVTGEPPSHPELLDWLAVEFQQDWDVKKFFKLLVTSATYRQSAAVTTEKLEKDPHNRYLSRGPRFRLDAEMLRDYALAASGLLVKKIGGPSVKPYQPEGVWEAVAMIGSNTRDYKRDNGDKLYRRSMYTFWKRAAPPASMEVLNAPNRETCTVRRERTNTPLQALVTLNDVQFVEAARVLAENAIKSGDTDEKRLTFVAKRLLARPFTPRELPVVKESLAALVADYKGKPAAAKKLIAFGESKADTKLDPATLAAWTMLCNELLNLDEVLNK